MSRAVMLPGFGASRRRCRAISASPDDMLRGDIDLLGTVLDDLDKYRGDERVDIRGVPAHVITGLRRWMAWAEDQRGKQINKGAAIACAAVHGLHMLEATGEARAWKLLKRQADVLRGISARAEVLLDEKTHGHRFELPNPLQGARVRLNFRCGDAPRKELFGAADRFGIAASALIVTCFTRVLADQPGFHDDLRGYMLEAFGTYRSEIVERTEELRLTVTVLEKYRKASGK